MDRYAVGEGYLRIGRVVLQIVDLFIADILDIRVLRGLDGKSALIESFVSLRLRVAQTVDHILNDLIRHLIYEIGIDILIL